MILAVTMNPSVDIAYVMDEFKLDDVNRVESVRKTAGGKGLNVARVIAQMEEEVIATGVLGGTIGEYIIQELNQDNIRNNFLKINKESRNCIAILHEGRQTEILESGPMLASDEGTAFLEKFRNLLSNVSIVTISGSLPNGLPADYYHKILEITHEQGIPVILDASGESLKQALLHTEKPFAIKPNTTELSQLLGIPVEDDIRSLIEALDRDLFNGIEWIVVSMGGKGAFAKHGGVYYRITIPKINVVNPVGSGDATVAGLAVALSSDKTPEAVLKMAMTTGMLNTMEQGTGYINLANFDQYYELVKITKIDG